MSELTGNEYLAQITQLATEKAAFVANSEITHYEKEHPNALVTSEVREIIMQRATSLIMLRLCNFKGSRDGGADMLKELFENWYLIEEKELRESTFANIDHEVKKRIQPGDENLSFSERFRKEVAKNAKEGNTISLLNSLKD